MTAQALGHIAYALCRSLEEAYDAAGDSSKFKNRIYMRTKSRRWSAMRTGASKVSKVIRGFAVLAGLLTVAITLIAHHGHASYDDEAVTLKGTVKAWRWTNP